MTRITLISFYDHLSFEKSLEEREGEMKCIQKISFIIGQDDCRKLDFASPNSSKTVLLVKYAFQTIAIEL